MEIISESPFFDFLIFLISETGAKKRPERRNPGPRPVIDQTSAEECQDFYSVGPACCARNPPNGIVQSLHDQTAGIGTPMTPPPAKVAAPWPLYITHLVEQVEAKKTI